MIGFSLPRMWCGVLGPLVVRNDAGEDIPISGPARRLLLTALLSRAGRTVTPDVLIEDIWGALPPRSAAKTLQSHVVRLRDDLGRTGVGERLITDRVGYRLDIEPDDVDAFRFETDVHAAMAVEDDVHAMTMIDSALALWRGDAYEEFTEAAFTVPERIRLAELRLLAEEQRADRALAIGEAASLVGGLEKRVAEAPYRERFWEQLILALYRSGRQAEALGAYRRARERLDEDLGVEPGPALRDLETRVLRQDPDLLVSPPRAIPAPRRDANRCPYLGLASYGDTDSDLFVGRERLTSELVGRVADHRVVVVAGASGTGKSSVLRAGLIPALRAGALPGSTSWRSAVRTPGDDVRAAVSGGLDLLVLDQAEELFTSVDAADRAATVELLEQFVESGGRLVLALRGDFYGRLADVQPFGAYAQAATVLVGALRADDVRRVVVEPAQRLGLICDDDFVEAVMDDVAGQPAALPLLSAALVRTWENRTEGRLTLAGYRAGGGFASALEATAERAYHDLSETERTTARRLLVRLAELDGEQWVRRPLRRADLDADPSAASVAARLADLRIVTLSPSRVELTHDALLVYWPRLRGWLAERVRSADLLDHLVSSARAWQEADRSPADVYRGMRLQSALEWQDEHPDDVSDTERDFLAASADAADTELRAAHDRAEREARGRRRLRVVVAALAVVVVIAGVVAVVAAHERSSARHSASRAQDAALTADSRRLAAESVNAPDIETSSLLAAAAFRLQDSNDSRSALLSAVERNQAALWHIPSEHRLLRVEATPDGARIAVFDNRQHVTVYATATRRAVASFDSHSGTLGGITSDGRQVIVFGHSSVVRDGPNPVTVLDVATGKPVRTLVPDGDQSGPEPAMTRDGAHLAVVTTVHRGRGVVVDLFDAHDWSRAPASFVSSDKVAALGAGHTDVVIELADGSVEVHDAATGRLTARLPRHGATPTVFNLPVAVAPDGTQVAVVSSADQHTVTLESTRGGSSQLPAQPDGVTWMEFSPDGAQIAVTSSSGSVAVYSTRDGTLTEQLAGHTGPALDVAWTGSHTPTGLYTVGLDSQLVSWSTGSLPRLVTQSGPDLATPDRGEIFGHYVFGLTPVQNAPRGSQIKAYLADLDTGRFRSWLLGMKDDEFVNQAVATPDGRLGLISIESFDSVNRVEVWDLTKQVRLRRLALPSDVVKFELGVDGALAPDGRTAFVSVGPTRTAVFDVASGRYLRSFTVRFAEPNADRLYGDSWLFAPDGKLLYGAYDPGPLPAGTPYSLGMGDGKPANHRLGLVDTATGRLVAQVGLGDISATSMVAWSHDGSLLAVGTTDGTVTLHDAHTLVQLASAGTIEPGYVHSLYFSPDDRSLVVGGTSAGINVLSVPDLGREGGRISFGAGGNSGGVYAWYDAGGAMVGFAPDAGQPGGDELRWFRFPTSPAALLSAACALAGSDITANQWQRYVGSRPYEHVCSG